MKNNLKNRPKKATNTTWKVIDAWFKGIKQELRKEIDSYEEFDVSEFLYHEDDRGEIFQKGIELGRIKKAKEILGE